MFKNVQFILVVPFLLLINVCRAQGKIDILNIKLDSLEQRSSNTQAEKIHLHLDRAWYTQGDTIWFKAYAVAGQNHQVSTISGVLYLELIDDKDSVLKRSILHLNPGICWGDIPLPYSYKTGIYHLRAYTNWMRNDSAYIFNQKLLIGGLSSTAANTLAGNNSSISNTNKTVAVMPDIQFLPEGGELVNGTNSKIAFKVLNKDGLAIDVSGVILDANHKQVTTFKTQHAGMGIFWLKPQKGATYEAKIRLDNNDSYMVALPLARDTGFNLSTTDKKDSLFIKVAVNDAYYKSFKNTPFYLVAQCSGKAYFSATGKLVDTVINIPMAKKLFPSGIVQITLFSPTGEPLNERLAFLLNNDQQQINVNIKPIYKTTENVKIDLSTNNIILKPIQGSFSIAVTDETQTPIDEEAENTILTDLLLNADLQGKVEKPNYYFKYQRDSTRSDLDLLMLTQGFRKFNWKKRPANNNSTSNFLPERELMLSGTINTSPNVATAGGAIRVTSIKDHFAIDTTSDAAGRFNFRDLDLLDTTKLIINAFTADGSNNLTINVDKPQYLSAHHDSREAFYPFAPAIVKAMVQAYSSMQLDSMKNTRQLAEVIIKGKKKRPHDPVYSSNMRYSTNLNGPGKANQVIMGDRLRGCPRLPLCLASTIFGVSFVPDSSGFTTPYSMRSTANHLKGKHPMAIFVDGIQMGAEALYNYSGEDVYSVEVLTSISNLAIYGSNAPNGAIIITLKHGADGNIGDLKRVKGITTYNYKGYSKVREFYSPLYTSTNALPATDKRKTIYWNPNIVTDANGKASFDFFNAGIPTTYRIVIEGIDGYGYLGRQVLRYKVE